MPRRSSFPPNTRRRVSALPAFPAAMHEVGYHTVPERVRAVRLDGSVDYETSDEEVRHVQAGSLVLVEDTHGKGHICRHSTEAQTVIRMRCQTASTCHLTKPNEATVR